MRIISKLIHGTSRVLKKLLKYFNSTIILTAFLPSSPVEPVIFYLNLNDTLLPGILIITSLLLKTGSYL